MIFRKGLIVLMLMLCSVSSSTGEETDCKTIHIATPEWKNQTNKDGSGIYFDIVREVYEPVGIKMTYKFVPWERAEHMLESKEADAMVSALRRKERLTPEYPMWMEYTAVVFRKDNIKDWKGIESLRGKRALWIRGYDFHTTQYLKDIELKWEETDDHATAWRMLDKGRTDFYIDAQVDIDEYITENKVNTDSYRKETIWGEKAYMSFSKTEKSGKLIQIYDKRIIELVKSGGLKKIFEKYNFTFPSEAWQKEE